jgi:hypothetical protein
MATWHTKTALRALVILILALAAAGWAYRAAQGAAANGKGSDVIRQWVVCQYVNAGRNPYALTKDILQAKYGDAKPGSKKIFSMPKEVPPASEAVLLAEVGPPEATYPPGAIGLLAPTLGLLPNERTVLWVWFAINIAMVALVACRLRRLWPIPPGNFTAFEHWLLLLAILLVFPPTFSVLTSGQFSLVTLVLLVTAMDPGLGWLPRGLAFGLALAKPSLAPPFFFMPLVRREWKVLMTAIAVQALATGYVAVQTQELTGLFRDWLSIAGYFLNGMYTVQDWLNATGDVAVGLTKYVSFGLLALCAGTLYIGRRLPWAPLFAMTAMTALFWTYHGDYDFVMLVPILMPLAGWSEHPPPRRWALIGIVLFALLAVGLYPAVTGGDDPATRGLRWMTRIILIGLFIGEYAYVLWRARRVE